MDQREGPSRKAGTFTLRPSGPINLITASAPAAGLSTWTMPDDGTGHIRSNGSRSVALMPAVL